MAGVVSRRGAGAVARVGGVAGVGSAENVVGAVGVESVVGVAGGVEGGGGAMVAAGARLSASGRVSLSRTAMVAPVAPRTMPATAPVTSRRCRLRRPTFGSDSDSDTAEVEAGEGTPPTDAWRVVTLGSRGDAPDVGVVDDAAALRRRAHLAALGLAAGSVRVIASITEASSPGT